jgi:hypothetical protein
MIAIPTRFEALFKDDGTPTLRGALWIEEITRETNLNTPIQGTGSPEGVITAEVGQRYMDTAGASESVLYIKQTGVGNTGWILG